MCRAATTRLGRHAAARRDDGQSRCAKSRVLAAEPPILGGGSGDRPVALLAVGEGRVGPVCQRVSGDLQPVCQCSVEGLRP
jgi:hypothetical protein